MDNQSDGTEDAMAAIKEVGQQLETRVATLHNAHIDLIASLQTLVPDLVSSLDLSLKVISSFNNQPFSPIPKPLPPPPKPKDVKIPKIPLSDPTFPTPSKKLKPSPEAKFVIEDSGGPLSVVRAMVAICLLQRVPFEPINSSTILRKLENDQSITVAERAALREVGEESGSLLAVEMALRSMEEDNGGVDLEEFAVSGKPGVLVMSIHTARLLKELPPSKRNDINLDEKKRGSEAGKTGGHLSYNGSFDTAKPPTSENWTPVSWTPFRGEMGTRVSESRGMVGIIGVPRGVGVPPPMHTLPTGLHGDMGVVAALKPRTDEDEVEAMLRKKSFKEMQLFKTGEELQALIHRPTAKETVMVTKFKSKGGSQVKEYCTALTKEDCRRQAGSYIACEKVHFRRIIAVHTDTSLGDCSFLDTCRHMKACKYVHYELDPISDPLMMGSTTLTPPKPLMPLPQRAHYCSQVELGEAQWINCDIRSFRMDILGQFGVIMADPPWDIHMELPYGTMADNEMRTLKVPDLQTDGLIFLWVTGRAMELGRECLELWGYRGIEEIIWVKTNQLQRIIRTGRTGHWLNHSKEHCLVGIKGNPEVNRNIDTDVIVAEVRETSRKPDEMYSMLERIMPRARKVELFARMHNCQAGWMSLGNQLNGVRLVDEGLRARFKAAYPDVKVQPSSPPRSSSAVTELNPNNSEARNNNAIGEDEIKKSGTISSVEPPASQEKSMSVAVEMTS